MLLLLLLFRLSAELKKSKIEFNGGVVQGQCFKCSVTFDQHKIVQIHKVFARFPHQLPVAEGEEGITGRGKFKTRLSREENELMYVRTLIMV